VTDVAALFPQSYEASRARFRQTLDDVARLWPTSCLGQHRIGGDEDLTIDWIEAKGLSCQQNLMILTTGEHGIEAYVGSAMLQLFVDEFLPRLSPANTGLLLVHAINPWGMTHRRRTNAANVDLNRNFVSDGFNAPPNSDYAGVDSLLNPQRTIGSLVLSDLAFIAKLLAAVARLGPAGIEAALTLGQYSFPRGLYYGGDALQEETHTMIDLYRRCFGDYDRIVLLDMHTGYGPRHQMSLVNSCLESRDSQELSAHLSYPLVVKTDADEFFSIQGDMIDFVYTLVRDEFPGKQLYATTFEFGTLGDSILASFRSLRTLILENQLHWFGAKGSAARRRIGRAFEKMYAPHEGQWRKKAVADARQAFEGILRAEGYLT
jgi:hypothetical protein